MRAGNKPLHRPLERTYGDKDLPRQKARQDRVHRGRQAQDGYAAAGKARNPDYVFGNVLRLDFVQCSKNARYGQPKSSERIFNTGEGGLHPGLTDFTDYAAVQVASGRFGVHKQYLNNCRFIEIKIGQGAKPGIGGHLPGEKVTVEVSNARMIPSGSDAISPAPHHDIYSIEDLRQLFGL